MRPVSDRFLRTVRKSHRMRARATVLDSYQDGTEPTGTTVPIVEGTVTIDSTADVWSTLDITVAAAWGTDAASLITPYGRELFIERGIDYGDGVTEWVSLGYFRIDTADQESAPYGVIRVSASDRMAQVIDQRIPFPVQFPAGASHFDVFDELIVNGDTAPFPGATVEFDYDADAVTLGASQLTEDSRYDFLVDLIAPLGKVMHWDHRGVLVVRDREAMGTPVAVDSGADGVIVSLSRGLARGGYYNGVAVTGESTDEATPPPYALVTNDDVSDPLHWGGPFGMVPRFYSSSFITTDAQALTAGASILAGYVGLPYTVDLTAVPNPALEPNDIIRVTLPGGFVEDHVIESLKVPLTAAEALEVGTRAKSAEDIALGGYGVSPYGLGPYGD